MNSQQTTPATAERQTVTLASTDQLILGLMQQQAQLIAGQQLLLEQVRGLLAIDRITIIYQHGSHNSANVESQVNRLMPHGTTGKGVSRG